MRRLPLMALASAGVLTVSLVVATPGAAGSPTDSQSGGARVSAELDGSQEVNPVTEQPGAGDPFATGFAVATFQPGTGTVCYELTHNLVPQPFGFHIHAGEAGVNGAIVVDFFTDPTGVVPPTGCADVSRDVARQILSDPDGHYFNLHNALFPNGAIRGQLDKSSR